MTRFVKLALSGLTALSLTMTPMPASAGPDGEDIAKALAGLAVLGIIASAANDRKKRRRNQANTVINNNPYGSIEGSRSPRVIEGEIRRRGNQGRVNNQRFRFTPLPDRCVRVVSTSRGDRTVYGARCLKRNYAYTNRLPERCRLQVRTNNRIRNVYGARCLRRDGWQVAGF